MGTQEPTVPTLHAVLNAARVIQLQHAKKKRLTLLPFVRCAMVIIQSTTKAALSISSSKTAAVSLSPQPTPTRNLNQSSLLNALHCQLAHHLPIDNQIYTRHNKSYANVTVNGTTHNQYDNHSPITDKYVFSKFLDEFKSVINPLITLLTSVLSKLLDAKHNAYLL